MRVFDVGSQLKAMSRFAALALCATILGGCAGYQLFSADPAQSVRGWSQYVTPRSPENAVEQAVVAVAQTGKNSAVADADVVFIAEDVTRRATPVQCVDVVNKSSGTDRYAQKTVVRYRVMNDKIAAVSEATTEFFVDADLERAILSAVAKTYSSDPVILYNDGVHLMSIASHPINRCNAKVDIFEGDAVGTPTASKRVAICFSS